MYALGNLAISTDICSPFCTPSQTTKAIELALFQCIGHSLSFGQLTDTPMVDTDNLVSLCMDTLASL